jgi:hypothetical protein
LQMAAYHAVFMAATALIVSRGILQGIESAMKVLMPILIALIVVLSLLFHDRGRCGREPSFPIRPRKQACDCQSGLGGSWSRFFLDRRGPRRDDHVRGLCRPRRQSAAGGGGHIAGRYRDFDPCGTCGVSDRVRQQARPVERTWLGVRHAAAGIRSDAVWGACGLRVLPGCWSWPRSRPRSRCSKCRSPFCGGS